MLASLLGGGPVTARSTAEPADWFNFRKSNLKLPSINYGAFLQDSDGFVWLGSLGGGLFRYDGHELKQFAAGPQGVSGNMINSIVQAEDRVIWIGTFSNGVTRYDKKTGRFTHFKHDPSNTNSLGSNSIPFTRQALFVDRDNRLWVGSEDGGVSCYDPVGGSWKRYRHRPGDPGSLASDTVMAICQTPDGAIWAGTKNGLSRLDRMSGRWTTYLRDASGPGGQAAHWVQALLLDEADRLWVGNKQAGLCLYDPGSDSFRHFTHDPSRPEGLAGDNIWNLYSNGDGRIWICHLSDKVTGLELYDPQTGRSRKFVPGPDNPGFPKGNAVAGIYRTRGDNLLWLLNFDGSVYLHDPDSLRIQSWAPNENQADSLPEGYIISMADDGRGNIWLGASKTGLVALNLESGRISQYRPVSGDPTTIPELRVDAILPDGPDRLWLGSFNGVLSLFDTRTGRCLKHFRHEPGNPRSLTQSRRIKYLIKDRDEPRVIWVATMGGGLDRLDAEKEEFTHYPHRPGDPESLGHPLVMGLWDDGRGRIWAATYGGGLNVLDKKTGKFKQYRNNPQDPSSLSSDVLYEVLITRRGEIWTSGKAGISRLDPVTGKFRNYRKGAPLHSNTITAMLEGRDGTLWLGSIDAGVARFDPQSESVRVFGISDGLLSNTVFALVRTKTDDGRLWFGSQAGICALDPPSMQKNSSPPTIMFTAYKQGGKDLDLRQAPELVKEIELDWRMNFIEFQFAALSFTNPDGNRFAYKLEGRDRDWYYSGVKPFGRYTGLSHGVYTLRVKGSNSQGVWNQEGAKVRIVVTPPFWRTVWFYSILAVLAVAAVFSGAYYIRRLRREIEMRRQSQTALQASEELFRHAFENAGTGVTLLDAKGVFLRVNRSFCDFLGYDEDWLTGRDLYAITHPDDQSISPHYMHQVESGATAGASFEKRYIHADGHVIWGSVSISLVRDQAGRFLYFVALVQDITRRKTMEAEKAALEDQLLQSQKMQAVGTLAGGIAHDFNNILTAIGGYAEIALRKSGQGESPDDYLRKVLDSGDRARDLVQRIMTYSRKSRPHLKPIQLNEQLQQSVSMLHTMIPKMIEIHLDLDEDLEPILADPIQLEQILLNLGSNARDAMPDGGVLRLTTRNLSESEERALHSRQPNLKTGPYVLLEVRDNGLGMDQETMTQAFDPFFTTKEVGEGTGLGLSSVLGIIEGHGGHISCQSRPGAGTTFEIYLPVATHTRERESRAVDQVPETGGQGGVLVVDDEPEILNVARMMLQETGYRTWQALSGEEALEVYQEHQAEVDVVVLDLNMPGMGGANCLKELLKLNPDLTVIIATGYTMNGVSDSALALGAAAFMAKPYRPSELIRVIRKTLRQD